MPVETVTGGREFARRFSNTLCELQLQQGIYRRADQLISEFGEEHGNLRGSYISREVDESYFPASQFLPEALARPKLQGIALDNDKMYEFVAFAHGLRRDVSDLRSVVHVQETWLEPKADEPFVVRVAIYHTFPAVTVLLASTGEGQDAIQDFVGRLKYLRGW